MKTAKQSAIKVIRTLPDDSSYEDIIYRNYRIVYQIDERVVEIITVSHGSKLLE